MRPILRKQGTRRKKLKGRKMMLRSRAMYLWLMKVLRLRKVVMTMQM